MNRDPASLDRLRDIAVPSPVSWWPPAAGWWVVFAIVMLLTTYAAYQTWKHWRSNAYRRSAAAELDSTQTVSEVNELLKRTALAKFPRREVAQLTGPAWCNWLESTCSYPLSNSVRDAMTHAAYQKDVDHPDKDLVEYANQWIRTHQVSGSGGNL